MMIDYSPLWETMKKKNISQYQLLKQGIDNKTLNRLKNNKNITVLTLLRLSLIHISIFKSRISGDYS